ncbi:hypothetical protein NDU88_003709 [Pleurodeles waltl]|uniref:Uncharacterized protein n=1 Tax=Pleurodeles waltl TaxID=8319 RepID=A0AAV7UEU3_PLEWA|nr:hypothetical protein NDU88_003709 [Pleurodeles waltl]
MGADASTTRAACPSLLGTHFAGRSFFFLEGHIPPPLLTLLACCFQGLCQLGSPTTRIAVAWQHSLPRLVSCRWGSSRSAHRSGLYCGSLCVPMSPIPYVVDLYPTQLERFPSLKTSMQPIGRFTKVQNC